ncbi:MAG: cation-transporting P-type ATPase [Acidobacteriota bacterium]|nr:cation-transporting P-type ATPase [Acidobacteriota bacterium]
MATKKEWYRISGAEVLKHLGSNAGRGLDSAEAAKRCAQFGFNELVGKEGRTRGQILAEQLSGVLTVLLLIVAAESRSEEASIFKMNFLANRPMAGAVLRTVGLQLAVIL